ncbi:MAG: Trm112 family protein [Candidatus Hermodarchaeota archaeon]
MKPWLFDILACPIDKHFPLELFIFSFGTSEDEFQLFVNNYKKRDLEIVKKENIIEIYRENDNLFVKDNIIIEQTPIQKYLELISLSINELDFIHDKSSNKASKICFNIIKNEIKKKIINYSKNIKLDKIETLLPEFIFINKIKLETEIESGLLFCPRCKRWFPIRDSIPQMLPDEYRNENEEIDFLKLNSKLLGEKFFKHDLKPFNI